MVGFTQPGGSISSGMPTPDQYPVSGTVGGVNYPAYQAAVEAYNQKQAGSGQSSTSSGLGGGGQSAMVQAQEQANFTGQPVTVPANKYSGQGGGTVYPTNTTAKLQSMATTPGTVASTGNFTGGSVGGPTSNVGSATNLTPWDQQRGAAATTLASTMDPGNDPSNLYRDKMASMVNGQFSPSDPSYQFRLDQGQKTLERSLAAKGLLQSGNAGAELQAYGQNTASTEYGAQFARLLSGLSGVESQYNTQQQRLMTMAGVGADPTASGTLGVAQTNAATQQAQVGVNQQKVSNDFTAQMAGLGNNSNNVWANIWG